jgi:hypothetical protein
VETKICSKCLLELSVNCFGKSKQNKDGLRSHCNECRKLESKKYRTENKEKRLETLKKYYENNKEKELLRFKQYRIENKIKRQETIKKYYENNKKIINDKQVKLNKIYYTQNINLYKLKHNCRGRIICFLKKTNIRKTSSTFDIVGCTPQFLKEHLEKQFKDGMNWENYGLYGWHIDHIIPLSSAEDEDGVYKLCHYTNLQPLWAFDNLSKGSKIIN